MKTKRNLILVVFVLAAFMAAAFPVLGDSSAEKDYRVIKNAVKEKKDSGEISWFRIEVTDKKADKVKVKIKLPMSVIDLLIESDDDLKIDSEKCKLNLKKILAELKKAGPTTLIEVEEDDVLVKIWIE
jgi:hypothetical protein